MNLQYDPKATVVSPNSQQKQKKTLSSYKTYKSMLIITFNIRGIVPKEFLPPSQTVRQVYCEVLKAAMWRNHPE